jgi:hypothetical protein
MACSLAGLLLAAALVSAAEPVPPARIYSKLPPAEIEFKATNKARPVVSVDVKPPAVVAPAPFVPANAAEPVMPDTSGTPDPLRDQSLFEPPSPESLFSRLDSEKMFEQRLRQQGMQRNPPEVVKFPDKPTLTKVSFKERSFPAQVMYAEPAFVCYNRLYFEEKNSERYGWDLGFIQPVVSVAYFYKDVLCFPHNFFRDPCRRYECNAGYCLPGDPVPYIFYPPDLSLGASIGEGAVAVVLIALFHGL